MQQIELLRNQLEFEEGVGNRLLLGQDVAADHRCAEGGTAQLQFGDGLVQATMAQQPYMMGQLAVKNAIAIIEGKGKDIPALQYQDAVLVNKGNVSQNDPSKFYGPNAVK